jgi:hypothetical protein
MMLLARNSTLIENRKVGLGGVLEVSKIERHNNETFSAGFDHLSVATGHSSERVESPLSICAARQSLTPGRYFYGEAAATDTSTIAVETNGPLPVGTKFFFRP